MSPRTSLSIQVRTRSIKFLSLTYPTTLYLLSTRKLRTVYFVPAIVSTFVVALLAAAPFRKPSGVIQKLYCESHAEVRETYRSCVWSVPFWTRIICTCDAVAARSMSCVYDFTRTNGHRSFGFLFCPIPALEP